MNTYDLIESEMTDTHLANLAKACGYPSLRVALNQGPHWGNTLADTQRFFEEKLAEINGLADAKIEEENA